MMLNTQKDKHIIIARVDNKPGVVSRMSGLFTRRGYNIESLVTGMTEDASVYNMTITMIGTEEEVRLLIHQLEHIMEVIEVYTAAEKKCVTRELMFIKLWCGADKRAEAMSIARSIRLNVAGVAPDRILFEVCGDEAALQSAAAAFDRLGRLEIVRSGALTVSL